MFHKHVLQEQTNCLSPILSDILCILNIAYLKFVFKTHNYNACFRTLNPYSINNNNILM